MTRFKNVVGYKGYKVSILGDVMTFKNNRHGFQKEGVLMNQRDDTNGYLVVTLRNPGEKPKSYKIHKIVMDTFVGPANGLDVNHKNGDRYDNRLSNLEYCTRSENIQHSYDKLGRIAPQKGKFGKESNSGKLVKQFTKEGEFIKEYGSTHEAERVTGIGQQNIGKVCNGKRKSAGGFKWCY